ncbi:MULTISPECIES: GTP-binding protein [unclassified Paenibacillus]|uniref:CobW family GTP-binding protein n=1 Tax=unclassified Paenibacillus TaxID=185978 RepID=UPI000BA61C19|nr:GTP-binding protein [Paenibacillus sp. 7541]PAK53933.1 cobalamin biosynthesis protein CobW [Paenibacillus sp. 7541]
MTMIPILILSGFLGSGKTTLLTRLLGECVNKSIKPAVIMNEVGDVNLDGQLVDEEVAMREMLSGCICCTIRGDLSMEIKGLIEQETPDLILIEATGVANPIEILDTVTETALLTPIDIRAVVTIVDASHFLQLSCGTRGRTYRLMEDQIRCASMLVLNKRDLVGEKELEEVTQLMAALNPVASIQPAIHCELDECLWNLMLEPEASGSGAFSRSNAKARSAVDVRGDHHHAHNGGLDSRNDHGDHDPAGHDHHHSYDHVMVCTHYFSQPVDNHRWEQVMNELPDGIYRAKGVYTASTGERMLFQYAYKQLELIPIRPQGQLQDVAVFIGEHFSKQSLLSKLEEMA